MISPPKISRQLCTYGSNSTSRIIWARDLAATAGRAAGPAPSLEGALPGVADDEAGLNPGFAAPGSKRDSGGAVSSFVAFEAAAVVLADAGGRTAWPASAITILSLSGGECVAGVDSADGFSDDSATGSGVAIGSSFFF